MTLKNIAPVVVVYSALPEFDHAGESTGKLIGDTLYALRANGVKVQTEEGVGIWFADDGTRYDDRVLFLSLLGDEDVMRRVLAVFGEAAAQREMLFVKRQKDLSHIVGSGRSDDDAAALAKEHGGATWLPGLGMALALRYDALKAGVDYRDSELTYAGGSVEA